ncbi:tyrosine-type recombinase/integrase [Devosia salina]|uniref:Site-specific integrase n=1 Tax=Devosia salina TaxID=2860336 RepID=A0ABX8W9Q0_9HYPH|nr:site-specific integrase [Devosia salina]QYO75608.1 site-specific integrase [Devosia salina]
MSRNSKGARLWLKPAEHDRKTGKLRKRSVWLIRDGEISVVTGCAPLEREQAEKQLAEYIAQKYKPSREKDRPAAQILVTDVLQMYIEDVAPTTARPEKVSATVLQLGEWWQGMTLADVTGKTCREYVEWRCQQPWKSARPEKTGKPPRMVTAAGARRELEDLRAAINHHRKEGYCREHIDVVLPDKSPPKDRWLTRDEAARLIWTCWRMREMRTIPRGPRKGEKVPSDRYRWRHLARFILVGLYSGSRAGAICGAALKVQEGSGYIDLERGVFYRRKHGRAETNKRQPPARLPSRLLAHIRRWAEDRGDDTISKEHVIEYRGKAISVDVNKAFALAVRAAGLGPDVTPHVLRHTAATWMMQNGADLWDAAGYLGMSVQVLESTYGHHHPDHQQSAIDAITAKRRK